MAEFIALLLPFLLFSFVVVFIINPFVAFIFAGIAVLGFSIMYFTMSKEERKIQKRTKAD